MLNSGIVPKETLILGASLKGGSEDLHKQGATIAENGTLTKANRCYVGFRLEKGQGIQHPNHHPRNTLLSGPISRDIAIVSLRYPLSRDTFSAIAAIPQEGAIPPLGAFFYTDISVRYPILQHIARYLCDTPGKQARKHFAILSLKVSRDMKSIATGPLRYPFSD